MVDSNRPYSVVVFGASGAVGRKICKNLGHRGVAGPAWAAAARNKAKTLSLLEKEGLNDVNFILADVTNYDSLLSMTRSTKVIINCAGPFSLYGENVVKACIEGGADYCDITGEAPWVRKMKRRYGVEADAAGVRIVHMVGFDCIPADILTNAAHKAMQDNGYGKMGATTMQFRCTQDNGVCPPGTFETMKNALSMRGARKNPKGGNGDSKNGSDIFSPVQKKQFSKSLWGGYFFPTYVSHENRYMASFFMRPVNTSTVHWSASQLDYGDSFTYKELWAPPLSLGLFGSLLFGLAVNFSTIALLVIVALAPRRVVDYLGSLLTTIDPGSGMMYSKVYAENAAGDAFVETHMEYNGDAGIMFTVLSTVESALLLADTKRDKKSAQYLCGFVTTAQAFGTDVITRMEARGLKFTLSHGRK